MVLLQLLLDGKEGGGGSGGMLPARRLEPEEPRAGGV